MLDRRSLLLLPSALTLTACMPRALEITVSGTAAAIEIAAFTRDGPFELFRSSTKIASLTVCLKDAGPQAPLWRVKRVSGVRTRFIVCNTAFCPTASS